MCNKKVPPVVIDPLLNVIYVTAELYYIDNVIRWVRKKILHQVLPPSEYETAGEVHLL